MDGDSVSRQIILDTNLVWPTALAIDTIVQRLFFTDTKLQRIETIQYDGTARKILVSKGLVQPLSLAVFEDHLYYTDYSLNTIFTVNKRTGQRLGQLKKNLRRPTGIDVVHPLHQKQGRQGASNLACFVGRRL
jgi:sugar lactone lactonase YvrE